MDSRNVVRIAAALGGVAVGGAVLLKLRWRPGSIEDVPARMKRVVLVKGAKELADAKLEVQEVETPKPAYGQVLVKIAAAPINPSDDGQWKNTRVSTATPIGNEGSGIIVASGGGPFTGGLLGKKVSIAGQPANFAQYAIADAATGIRLLPQDVPAEDGCAFFINPFTVVGILESVREDGGKAFIQTAAASQLGMMLAKLCQKEGVTLVNLVRRAEQKATLIKLGVKEDHIVVTGGSNDWQAELSALIEKFKIRHAFDAVSGDMTGTLLSLLPSGGTVWVYGRLAPEPVGNIQPLDLIYRGKQVKGFLLPRWLMQGGLLKAIFRNRRCTKMVSDNLRTIFASDFQDVSMENMHAEYIKFTKEGRTGTKMRVRP
mmetsp:Transcript_11473/g.31054  ORF Transcript_11473/g.31054 Transcript_11473/m.31054 type:complete len:373 (-) Transcript_11473:85-1203(-)